MPAMLINQLSKETETPIHTIRYYEKYGLLKGKKDNAVKSNNYTWYDEEAADKLALIKEAKEIGFSLGEIKSLIDAWYSNRLSKERKKEILLNKVREIEGKILHMKKMKKMLLDGVKGVDEGEC